MHLDVTTGQGLWPGFALRLVARGIDPHHRVRTYSRICEAGFKLIQVFVAFIHAYRGSTPGR